MDLNTERITMRISKEEEALKKEEDLILKEERRIGRQRLGKARQSKKVVKKPRKRRK